MENYTFIKNKKLPKDFKKAVALLQRPYFYISESVYNDLLKEAQKQNSDILEDCNGRQFTFGNCDGDHYALMPLIKNI